MGLLGQESVSVGESEAEHIESGQVLVLVRVPDPQVTEQEDHSPQLSKDSIASHYFSCVLIYELTVTGGIVRAIIRFHCIPLALIRSRTSS